MKYIIILSIFLSINCFADAAGYISGQDLYKQTYQTQYPAWQFLDVPFDYSQPDGLKTAISYKVGDNFSADKKTVIFFMGGPGGSSIAVDFVNDPDVNFIYFNERGVAFSKPETQAMYLNPDYYSSENTARDAFEIVKHLGLKKVTVYGQSDGTVPATIFASLFPEHTNSAILEGTVFDGTPAFWEGVFRTKLIQEQFDSYPSTLQQNILKYSNDSRVPKEWFFIMAMNEMQYGFADALRGDLKDLFPSDTTTITAEQDQKIVSALQQYQEFDITKIPETIDFFNPTVDRIMICKELSGLEGKATWADTFQGSQLVWVAHDTTYNCPAIGITTDHIYHATDYPIDVPVYYFQGYIDPQAPQNNAVAHFKQVPRGNAQLIMAMGDGHAVIIDYLWAKSVDPKDQPNLKAVKDAFNQAVNGLEIDTTALNKAFPEDDQWVSQTRNW